MANTVADILHSVYRKHWQDAPLSVEYDVDAVNHVLNSMFGNIMHITQLYVVEDGSIVNAFAAFLSSLSIQKYRHTVATYKKDAWNHFLSKRFFLTDVSSLHNWQWIISRVLEDKNKLKYELLNNPTSINVFAKHETDVNNRAQQLKRLAFVIHAGRRDQYGRYLTQIVEFSPCLFLFWRAARTYTVCFSAPMRAA